MSALDKKRRAAVESGLSAQEKELARCLLDVGLDRAEHLLRQLRANLERLERRRRQ